MSDESRVEEGMGSNRGDTGTNRVSSGPVHDEYRAALRALLGLIRRPIAILLAYVVTMTSLAFLVATGGRNWALLAWAIMGSVFCITCMRLVRQFYMVFGGDTSRRRRQRISRGALEARLQLSHPGIELGRLRLLLVDRDFTGEDYQALLDLDENNQVPSTAGASEREIRRNPSFLLKEAPTDSLGKNKSCTICLYPLKPAERVRIIPCLHQFHTEGQLPPNSLVRYVGMVQDQYEPEFFIGSFEEVDTATGQRSRVDSKYTDCLPQKAGFINELEGPDAKTMERLPVFCIPVPGQSPWAQSSPRAGKGSQQRDGSVEAPPKRPREPDDDIMECTDEDTNTTPGDQVDAPVPSPQAKAKRPAEDETAGNESASSEPESAFHHGQELELEGVACVVKLYDYAEGDLKLNDTAEFVGVLGYDDQSLPSHEEEQTGSGDPFQGMEHFSRKVPPPSLAPRLHCIFYRAVPACAPLAVDPKQPKDALYALQGPLPFGAFMLETKRHAIAHLARALGGDVTAAEYTLLALLSRAYVRTESSAPGSLSLNLRGMSADEVPAIGDAIADIVPKCVTVPITTQSLAEKFKFAPKKDYEADRLMVSSLQLSEGTVVLLDETRLEPGQIGAEGVNNISALKSLVSVQKVPYDFRFYKTDLDVDHPTIAISSRGSVVPTGAVVPIVASGETHTVSDAATLAKLRVYVEATRRMDLSLDEVSSSFAEEAFVRARQQGHNLTGDDFHRMLTIARLTALSLGEGMMNASHWSHMKDLEARVAGRARDPDAEGATQAIASVPTTPNHVSAHLNAIPEDS